MSDRTILVVDDDPANLKLLRLLLTREGYTVLTVIGAEDALAELEISMPAAVLTDIQLPGMNGLQLAHSIRSNPRTKDILILGISANAMKENIEAAYAAGCDGYITKPIDTRMFAGTIDEYLMRGRSKETSTDA
jgi:two-component system cell cycle response regulator DivK